MRNILIAALVAACVQFGPMIASELAAASDTNLSALQDVGVANAAFIRRQKIRKRVVTGYKVVVVVGADEGNEVSSVDVTIRHEPGQPEPFGGDTSCDSEGNCETTVTLTLRRAGEQSKRFVFKDLEFSDDASGLNYTTTATMLDEEGQTVGEPLTALLNVKEPNAPAEPSCMDGVQNGGETGVDCGGPDCGPCDVQLTIAEAAAFLQETAVEDTTAAAELLGEVVLPDSAYVKTFSSGGVARRAVTESGRDIVLLDGPTSVTIDQVEVLDLGPNGLLTIDSVVSHDVGITVTIRSYDSEGNIMGELTQEIPVCIGNEAGVHGRLLNPNDHLPAILLFGPADPV